MDPNAQTFRWWERGIVYQIYPRSFMDSNGDGIGDLAGIRQKLDYLQWLGVDAVWISPIYPSPMADFGYDVSDYTDIDPLSGSLGEFDTLLADVHARGMKLLLDFVPNHTSERHPWFIEAKSSRSRRNAPGISGAIRLPAAARRTTGSPFSADSLGRGTPDAASIIFTTS